MKTYLITYDLKKPGRDYKSLMDAIRAYPSWAHVQLSVWMVQTDQTAVQIRDSLNRNIDSNDSLFVIAVGNESAWTNLDTEISDWIQSSLAA